MLVPESPSARVLERPCGGAVLVHCGQHRLQRSRGQICTCTSTYLPAHMFVACDCLSLSLTDECVCDCLPLSLTDGCSCDCLQAKRVHIWDANGSREFLDKQGLQHREVKTSPILPLSCPCFITSVNHLFFCDSDRSATSAPCTGSNGGTSALSIKVN